ncbi:MAG: type I methionyl aminopeptidase [Armatimonadota bacterium]
MVVLKTPLEIEKMRVAGGVVAKCLKEISESIIPGETTTMDIDKLAEELLKKYNAISSFKNYRGYPATACVAVNEEVVHGIPGIRVLKEGDIVGIDLGAIVDGWHGDSAITVAVGKVSKAAEKLMQVTKDALYKGIDAAKPGNRLSDIGNAIQNYVEKHGYTVVKDLAGHGIGKEMHEDPQVLNYGSPGRGLLLEEGMTLAIEPMVNIGSFKVITLPDNWTVVTKDGSLSAHFEHTVAITKDGPDILTAVPTEEALRIHG